MSYLLRPYDAPRDDVQTAAVFATADPDPWTVADIVDWRRTFPEGGAECDLVAVDEQNMIIGNGYLHRMPWMPEGQFHLRVVVHPGDRGQGVGSALFAGLEKFAHDHGATSLLTTVNADAQSGVRFAEQRGFTIRRHEYVSRLHLAHFDEAPFARVLADLQRQGLRFFAYADEPRAAALYEVVRRNYADMPGVGPDTGYMSLGEWRQRWVEDPESPLDCIIIAADGDQLVGVTRMGWYNDQGEMKTYHSSVIQEYRGRTIAVALKLLAIRAARRHGATALLTNNDSRNTAILRVNEQFGYVPTPGIYHMQRG
jgi:GNAT superfamily N-acetyltransferase